MYSQSSPLTHIYTDNEMSASEGAYYSFSLNRSVVLLSDSAETPRITVRVVKLDDPKDWPAPPPVDRRRTLTPPPDAAGAATVDPAPPPPPTQEDKKPKKRRREFFMAA